MTAEKKCPDCERILPTDSQHWYRDRGSVSGWTTYCKQCWGLRIKNKRHARRMQRLAEEAAQRGEGDG